MSQTLSPARPLRVAVVIPALNEEATVGHVVRACLADAAAPAAPNPAAAPNDAAPYDAAPHDATVTVAEVIVIDSDSTDATAQRAREAGARVVNWRDVLPHLEPVPGKGEALWRGVAAVASASCDAVCFVDADLESAAPGLVQALCAPLADPEVHLVKARYARTFEGAPSGGGRVTELAAKPLLRAFFPELVHIEQPLGGEYALRLKTARELPFVAGYGVEVGLLIDVARTHGAKVIAQADLPARRHRNRPLHELAPMADVVARTILGRAGVEMAENVAPCAQRPPLNQVG